MMRDIAPAISAQPTTPALVDPFGRQISYLRVSLTDRCDLRCAYCMPERMEFLPRKEILTIEELLKLCRAFIDRGVRRLRLTGGEPLVRKGADILVRALGQDLAEGRLDELTMTTNGVQLEPHAQMLADAGLRRINISLDTLQPDRFERITRRRVLDKVLAGIKGAADAGLRIKLNVVALKGVNEDEIVDIIAWAHARGYDVSLIEVMPLGEVDEDRFDQYLPLTEVRDQLERCWTLEPVAVRTGGPSRYSRIRETGGLVGFISPLTNNFCDGCNRIRLTCTGRLYMCLGQDDSADFRALLRAGASEAEIRDAIDEAVGRKPKGHAFEINRRCSAPALSRVMAATGG